MRYIVGVEKNAGLNYFYGDNSDCGGLGCGDLGCGVLRDCGNYHCGQVVCGVL